MDIPAVADYTLNNLNKINIVLGKNGCGKSIMLREVEKALPGSRQNIGKCTYITPERGGTLTYDANIERQVTQNVNYLSQERRANRSQYFRPQSAAQYRKLETVVLREIEKEKRGDKDYTFDVYVGEINSVLDNIEIRRADTTFKIYKRGANVTLAPEQISSGESELISLVIECLIFSKECVAGKDNILFLDEPDVHLHPDLQVRLMHFLKELVAETNFKVLIATHSTALLGALESYTDAHIAFMEFGQKTMNFKPITAIYKKILPVFGAHPLSNIFKEAPILLVEGEDDERIWQQAVRSSDGNIKLYPCPVGSINKMNGWEQETKSIIDAVYDKAKAYSLRDRDENNKEELPDLPPVIRMQLACRNAENLLLTDEVLSKLGTDWERLKQGIETWLGNKTEHPHYRTMDDFKNKGFDRRNHNVKDIRNDLMSIIGSEQPWEAAVGRTLAKLTWDSSTQFDQGGSIYSFLGKKVVNNLLPARNSQ